MDGCDISPDMLALCRERAKREGVPPPTLFEQAVHELDLPRRYRTIVFCGGFGLGGQREHDLEGLRRLHGHLEPGGTLVLDNDAPYADTHRWPYWLAKEREGALPCPWRETGDRRVAPDGAEYELRSRLVDLDPLSQKYTFEMRAAMWRDGELVAEEEHSLELTTYFTHEVLYMLQVAGFSEVTLRAGSRDEPPTAEDDVVVFVARKD